MEFSLKGHKRKGWMRWSHAKQKRQGERDKEGKVALKKKGCVDKSKKICDAFTIFSSKIGVSNLFILIILSFSFDIRETDERSN